VGRVVTVLKTVDIGSALRGATVDSVAAGLSIFFVLSSSAPLCSLLLCSKLVCSKLMYCSMFLRFMSARSKSVILVFSSIGLWCSLLVCSMLICSVLV
jgi:hypothetical protein